MAVYKMGLTFLLLCPFFLVYPFIVVFKLKHVFNYLSENFAKRSRDLDVGGQRSLDLQPEYQTESPIKHGGTKKTNQLETGSSKFSEQIDRGQLDLNSESPSSKLKYEAAKVAGAITKIVDADKEDTEYEASNKPSKFLDMNSKAIKDSKESPPLELGLKRLRGVKDVGTTIQDDRKVLRRSDSSAFSRYKEVIIIFDILIFYFLLTG